MSAVYLDGTDLSTSRCFQGSLINPTVTVHVQILLGVKMIATRAKTSVTTSIKLRSSVTLTSSKAM